MTRHSRRVIGFFMVCGQPSVIALPAFLLFGDAQHLPEAPQQWAVLLFLGLCSTALGMYWWNKGACLVNGGTWRS